MDKKQEHINKTKKREKSILDCVEKKNTVTVEELCNMFGVSAVTIRKDLNRLSESGLLMRTHGGAIRLKDTAFEQTQELKAKEKLEEKREIAKYAYSEIQDNETIIIDAGTTTQELAKLIRMGNKRKLTVATNAFNIVEELISCDKTELLFIGGHVRPQILSCVGMYGEDVLNSLCVDRVFLGCNSLSAEQGLTTPNILECRMKQCMLGAAKKKYVLIDSGKIRTNSIYKVCKIKDLDLIITDAGIGRSYMERIIEKGGHVALVNGVVKED